MSEPAETGRGGDRRFRELCRLYGVQPVYRGVDGGWHGGGDRAALQVLRLLGARLHDRSDVEDALRWRRLRLWERGLPPSAVAWDGRLPPLRLRRPAEEGGRAVALRVELEGGGVWEERMEARPAGESREVEGRAFAVDRVELPRRLPPGRHRLMVGEDDAAESWVISAPLTACPDPDHGDPARDGAGESGSGSRRWGVFLPLYALGAEGDSWGVGSLSDLRRLGRWSSHHGASVVGTLPLLPTFLDAPYDPSPYAPVSRLFWSELYPDLDRSPHLHACPPARRLLSEAGVRRRLARYRSASRVPYRGVGRLKLEVLRRLASCAAGGGGPRLPEWEALEDRLPDAESYAEFRATCHRQQSGWPDWRSPREPGELRAGRDFEPSLRDAHLYAQWLADRQLAAVARDGRSRGYSLYLDLPLSARADGYDVWRRPGLFAGGASVGAPPDPFFSEGQDWGFPPILPHEMRRRGFTYTRACLRHHMRHAGVLRVDHVMGLHRLFWIPEGSHAGDGVYVRYPWRELHALLNLESRRAGVAVVGEDLGTVPTSVRRAMDRHGLRRTFVMPFQLEEDSDRPVAEPPPESMASLNTHDMWPFAGWWRGADIDDREREGLLDAGEAGARRRRRAAHRSALTEFLAREGLVGRDPSLKQLLRASLELLGRSVAWCVLVNVEDLWLETRPQNVPGDRGADRSWRRRARHGLATLSRLPEVSEILERVDRSRRQG